MTKTKVNFPKFYICKYGVFYESQILEQYCCEGNHYYYSNDIVLEKFVVHYHNYLPQLYFRGREVDKTRVFTYSVEQLGIFFRKK